MSLVSTELKLDETENLGVFATPIKAMKRSVPFELFHEPRFGPERCCTVVHNGGDSRSPVRRIPS